MKHNFFILFVLFVLVSCLPARKLQTSYPELPKEYANFSGSLESVTYPTSIPGPTERRMYVYLPAEYYSFQDRHYPVLYLLHGARGSESSWITQGKLLPLIDSLTASGKIKPTIVVFPNMNSFESEKDYAMSRHKGALESFFEVDGAVESSFVRDVVNATDSIFRTNIDKQFRAIAGLSLGGMQALYISASSPDTFGYVGILSAPVHSCVKKGPYSDFYQDVDAKVDSQFVNPPIAYDIYVGKSDVYRHTMKKFHESLQARGYSNNYKIKRGGHQWKLWTQFALDFMQCLW